MLTRGRIKMDELGPDLIILALGALAWANPAVGAVVFALLWIFFGGEYMPAIAGET